MGVGRAHGVVLNVNDGKGACEDCGVRVVDANIYVYQPRALSTGKGIKNAQNGELWPLSVQIAGPSQLIDGPVDCNNKRVRDNNVKDRAESK